MHLGMCLYMHTTKCHDTFNSKQKTMEKKIDKNICTHINAYIWMFIHIYLRQYSHFS